MSFEASKRINGIGITCKLSGPHEGTSLFHLNFTLNFNSLDQIPREIQPIPQIIPFVEEEGEERVFLSNNLPLGYIEEGLFYTRMPVGYSYGLILHGSTVDWLSDIAKK
ncbi:MAG: hypothetical protein ACUVTD_09645, partial [Nitrososphaerales archaeon]